MRERELRGTMLIAIAREAIGERLGLAALTWRGEPWLLEYAASFVTLRRSGELRGCIGSVDARRPLADDVAHNACAAAFGDSRFEPVQAAEYAALEVEVSILSPRSPVAAASESEALACLRPGVDGVYLEFGEARATFLPQVWESIPDPLRFLAELRCKAELPPRFWHTELRISRYTVEKFAMEPPALRD